MGIFNNLKNNAKKQIGNIDCHSEIRQIEVSEQFSDEYKDIQAKLNAINRVQALIELGLDGTIITANKNFLDTVGYQLAEIQGKHHSMFVDAAYKTSKEYAEFWAKLNRGEYDEGQYKRIGKDGKELWLQASYNPVADADGKAYKIVKLATNITTQKLLDADNSGKIAALDKAQAVIEFKLDGTIITANKNFLDTVGYQLAEIQGRHHSMFVDAAYKTSREYAEFWAKLNRGEYDEGQYKRIGKDGKELWLQASYNPVSDADGKAYKIVKLATNITTQKLLDADNSGKISALDKAQAVIEFKLDGTIITANKNFLDTVGYQLAEIQGKHHSMFVDAAYKTSKEYAEFWAKLNRGEYDTGEYLRIGKGGKEVWIQASYNPINDADGKAYKIVKFATDITKQKLLQRVEGVVSDISRVMESLSNGDLTDKMDGEYPDQFIVLRNSVNSYIDHLQTMVTEIKESAWQVKDGAREISDGNSNLSQRTEEQAASLEETSSAMEQITTTVQNNAESARQANLLAKVAREQAEIGGNVVGQAIVAMQAIHESSNKINDILGVIDEIAFQTNLLALNAAVEAARAGDQGRGFAVVADEVRKLAGRSAAAAKEIKALIKDSSGKVQEGSELVNKSGETLKNIVTAVKKVNDIVAEISTASDEQAAGLSEVNRAVGQMDEITQQNAALVEEVAAASESLGSQAEELNALISFFNVEGGDAKIYVPKNNKTEKKAPSPIRQAVSKPQLKIAAKPALAIDEEGDKNWAQF